MKRLLGAVFIWCLLTSFAMAEDAAVKLATPTDLSCAHRHLEEVCYFDNPSYVRLDDENHRVYGVAVVDIVCADCGELISTETRRDAEEIRTHSFKNGVCSLCGARQPEAENTPEDDTVTPVSSQDDPTDIFQDAPGEQTLFPLSPDPEDPLLVLIITEDDLAILEEQSCDTLVIRPEEGTAAIVLPLSPLRQELTAEKGSLRAEIKPTEDGAVFAALRLQEAEETSLRDFSGIEGIQIRFYHPRPAEANTVPESRPKTVVFQPEDLLLPPLEEAVRSDPSVSPDSFTVIPWQGNGTYTPVTNS